MDNDLAKQQIAEVLMPELRCPNCEARPSRGDEFTVVEPYRASSTSIVLGTNQDGAVVIDQVDGGRPERFGTPEVTCESCGHSWPTARKFDRRMT